MRHVSRTHRVALDWFFDRINLDSKIQIKYIDTKNQLADILTKGNFTRDEWNHILCLFNISHFSSTNCSEVMSERTQEDADEERVTAKSKPMVKLVSRCSERNPDVLPSTAAESPVKTRHESQSPLSLQPEKYDRTARPVVNAQHTDRFFVENDEMNSYAEAESELSLESRSFLHRVNDQVWQRQNQSSKDATKDSDKHSLIWRMYMSSTLQASVFMEKNYSDNWHSIKNYRKFTMKQMFDMSEKLITEQSDEIYGMSTINWEHSSWKYLSLVGGAHVISLLHKKVYVFFRFCLVPWKDEREPTIKICMGRQIDVVQKFIRIQNFFCRIDGEPIEFEWDIFPGFTTLLLCHKVQELLSRLSVTPEKFTGRIIFMLMFNDISWRSQDNEKECESNAKLVSLYAKRFGAG